MLEIWIKTTETCERPEIPPAFRQISKIRRMGRLRFPKCPGDSLCLAWGGEESPQPRQWDFRLPRGFKPGIRTKECPRLSTKSSPLGDASPVPSKLGIRTRSAEEIPCTCLGEGGRNAFSFSQVLAYQTQGAPRAQGERMFLPHIRLWESDLIVSPVHLYWTFEQNGLMNKIPEQNMFISWGLPILCCFCVSCKNLASLEQFKSLNQSLISTNFGDVRFTLVKGAF